MKRDEIPARIRALRVELLDLQYRSRHSQQARQDLQRVKSEINALEIAATVTRKRSKREVVNESVQP